VRRGDTFPGLSPDHLRVAVRDPGTSVAFAADLAAILDPALPVTPAFRDLPRIPEEIR
jgi:histidinol-phosphate aminotransferase